MCIGMSIDLFSALPNLIILAGLGTGPAQQARERSWSQMKMGQTKTEICSGRHIKNTLGLQNWVTVFYGSINFQECDNDVSKTDQDNLETRTANDYAVLGDVKDPLLLATLH